MAAYRRGSGAPPLWALGHATAEAKSRAEKQQSRRGLQERGHAFDLLQLVFLTISGHGQVCPGACVQKYTPARALQGRARA